MKNGWIIMALLVLGAAGVLIRAYNQNGMARPGDTVRPQLIHQIRWQAGEAATLFVELVADSDSGQVRRLGFLPPRRNPIANVQFFGDNGSQISSSQVELSHRC